MNVNRLLDSDALEAEAQENLDMLNEAKSLLITFANDLKSIDTQLKWGDTSNYSESTVDAMRRIISDQKRVEHDLLAAKQTLQLDTEADDEDEEAVDIVACFDEKLQQFNPEINCNNDLKFRELVKIMSTAREAEDEDLETIETAPFRIPTDPFMKKQVENPVKNKRCGHIYDKNCFQQYLQMCANNPRKLICPIGGCQNKERLTENSVDEDVELRFKIRQFKFNSSK